MDAALLVFVGLNVATAASGAVFKPGEWYETLKKPSWRPPNIAFPIVWTALYAMIAASGWLVWHAAPPESLPLAMTLYGVQLVLNAAWSALFFGMRRMRAALVDLAALWVSILALIVVFLPIDRTAALLLSPYLLWVTIAGALNRAMIRLNPDFA